MISRLRAYIFARLTRFYLGCFENKNSLCLTPLASHNLSRSDYKVSIVMSVGPGTVFDELLECCSRLNEQDYNNFILFLFFDGTACNDFLNYLKMFKYPICIFESNVNLGLGNALNFLCKKSLEKGCDYIIRSDADDYSSPSRISTLISYLETNKHIDFVGSSYQIVSNISTLHNRVRKFPDTSRKAFSKSALSPVVAHATVAFRSQLFVDKLIYLDDYKIGIEDQLLWLQARLSNLTFSNLDLPLYFVRVNQSFVRRRLHFRKTFNLFVIRFLHALHPDSSIYFSVAGVLTSALRLFISIISIPLRKF